MSLESFHDPLILSMINYITIIKHRFDVIDILILQRNHQHNNMFFLSGSLMCSGTGHYLLIKC